MELKTMLTYVKGMFGVDVAFDLVTQEAVLYDVIDKVWI